MQKKNLLGGALLLLCTLFVFTGCKEIMSNLDDPVSSYFELKENSTTVYLGQTYKIEYTTISDAKDKVTFEVIDNKNVASVDAKGVVTGLSKGTAKIKVTLPASDYYQGATKEFTVTVDALLGLEEGKTTSVVLSKEEVYDLGVIAPEGSTPTYEPSNDNVTVDGNGVVTGKKFGDATVTVSVTAYGRSESLTFDIKVRVKNAIDFMKEVDAVDATADDNIILLAPDSNIDLTAVDAVSILFKGNVSVKGEEGKPATIKAKPFVMKKKIAFENVIIDAASLGSSDNLLTYSSDPDESLNTGTSASPRYNIYGDAIVLRNVTVENMPRGIISDNGKAYVPENVIISNSILHFVPASGNQSGIWFNTNNNGIKNLTIENSTVYASGNNKLGYFVKYANNARIDRFGYDSATEKIEFHYNNNTFYGLCSNYIHNYGNALKNYAKFDVTKNIFYYNNNNSTQTKQIVQRIVGANNKSAGTVLNFDGNAFLYNGTPYDCNQDSNKQSYDVDTNSVSYDPGFTDAANGNFKPTESHFTSEESPGDPRWRREN